VKAGVAGGAGGLGDTITYTFTVTNTGNVTLNGVTVTDPLPGLNPVTPASIASLAPGATDTFTATYTITQDDIDAGGVSNQATATGGYTDLDGDPQSVSDLSGTDVDNNTTTVTPLAQDPGIALVKAGVAGGAGGLGDTITYTFTVTNTGNVTLNGVTVTDPLPGLNPVTPASIASLAPGATDTFTATYTITQDDIDAGGVSNQATATGGYTDLDGDPQSVSDLSGTDVD
ncbi:hypothetical protein Q9295_17980, partial [Xinfangfangia sp. CPCC 101601]